MTKVQGDQRPLKSTALPPAPGGDVSSSRWAENFLPLVDSAQRHYEEQRLSDAITEFERLFQEIGKFASGLYRKAAASLKETGHQDQAAAVLQKALLHDPTNGPAALDLAQIAFELGVQAHSHKQPEAVIKSVQRGIDAVGALPDGRKDYAPILARLHHLKGWALSEQGRLSEAETEIEHSLRLDRREVYEQDLHAIHSALQKAARIPAGGEPVIRNMRKVGRNKPCPCGSGKKYKVCCERRS